MAEQLKVLCVDDNREAARVIGEVLGMAGCEVRVCLDGATALSVAEKFHPDVCVLDIRMPGMDGTELATRLREQAEGRSLRCIALTGLWDVDAQHRTHNVGFEEHLVKPVEINRLVESVTGRQAAGA
jgi:two-component system, OmpR family, response regulator